MLCDLDDLSIHQTPSIAPRDSELSCELKFETRTAALEEPRFTYLNLFEPQHIHIQHLCRARMGDREGIGILEQLVIGPHAPSGFESLFDGAR